MRSNMQIIPDHYAASDRADIAGMMANVSSYMDAPGLPSPQLMMTPR